MNELVKNPMGQSPTVKTSGSSASADSNRAIAEVQAALIVAIQNPRDQIKATDRIINAFTRKGLAESSQYQFSRGGADIKGPSIRAAEAIAQQWGNFQFGFRELSRSIGFDGVGTSEVSAMAWDMETNAIRTVVFHVKHWRDTKTGGYALKDERDIYELIANQAQRRVRSCILAIIPGDVVECAMDQATLTLKTHADCSPEAMQKMLEAFALYGVTKEQIETRIQRRIDAIQPAQVVSLKRIYASLRDGMSSVNEWFETDETGDDSGEQSEEVTSLNQSIKSTTKAAKKKASKKTEPTKPKPEPAEPDDNHQPQLVPKVTYAELMDSINQAQNSDLVDFVLSTEAFAALPVNQREEILHAAESKKAKLAK